MSLTKATYSMIDGAPANVLDFGADPTGVADSTAAIQAAQQASKYVYCPPGDYSVTGLRIYDHVNLIGAGYQNTRFLQRDPAQPAINCLSDATVGQLLSFKHVCWRHNAISCADHFVQPSREQCYRCAYFPAYRDDSSRGSDLGLYRNHFPKRTHAVDFHVANADLNYLERKWQRRFVVAHYAFRQRYFQSGL